MMKWIGGATGTCVLCDNNIETRDHLFFSCPFVSEIWAVIAKGIFKDKYSTDWSQLLDHVSNANQTQLESYLSRSAFQATVYTIWGERNGRRHGEEPHSTTLLTTWIDKHIRNKISTIRRMGDRRYDEAYQAWLISRT
uniref:Reverse transcriptase zinc-binding domain-containing protein n=1 Tax=Arabidopsis thaliana TaxID=3702 RepID=Q6DYD9_ARATH|nr:hypothetical protein At1G54955 [Arabidopsis thaliana]